VFLDAIDAARKDQPMPNGTVFTVVQYSAQLDAQGNPVKGADGRLVKGEIRGFNAMEKRTGGAANTRTRSAMANGSIALSFHGGQEAQRQCQTHRVLRMPQEINSSASTMTTRMPR
jgi:hypothetical protein